MLHWSKPLLRKGDIVRGFPLLLPLLAFALAATDPASAATRRPAGDTAEDPFWFYSIPAVITGNSCAFEFNYDVMCPYDSMSPDVVWAYEATETMLVDISLCLSHYDTKIQIYENEVIWGQPMDCNDDWCSGPNYPSSYLSHLEDVPFAAGNTYYLVISGYGGDCGGIVELGAATAEACQTAFLSATVPEGVYWI